MRQASLAKGCPAHFPASGTAGKDRIHEPMIDAFLKTICQTNIFGLQPDQTFGDGIQQTLTGAIDQTQSPFAVERKNSDLDFLHDFSQKGSRLERAEPLLTQR